MSSIVVALVGLVFLAMLAILVGRAVDRKSRDEGWKRIADERRRNWEERQKIILEIQACPNPNCPRRLRQADWPGI